jgi:Uma2 family endonuclease
MTEEAFEAWCDEDVKAEYVDGEVVVTSPAQPRHELVFGFLFEVLGLYVEARDLGLVLGAQAMIRLRPGLRRVPDLVFFTKERGHLVTPERIVGIPDLVVEIVSPDSVERDYEEKVEEYAEAGIREYWRVDPEARVATFYQLQAEGYVEVIPDAEGVYRSGVVSGFWVRVAWFWQEPLPKVLGILRALGVV